MSDITLFPLGLNLTKDENPEAPMLSLVIPTGTLLPIDTGTGQPLPIPIDTYRVPIPKALAIELGQKLVEEAEALPDPQMKPDIAIASDLNEANVQAAQAAEQALRAGRPPTP